MSATPRIDVPEGKFTSGFFGYDDQRSDLLIKLPPYNTEPCGLGTSFVHLDIGRTSLIPSALKASGIRIIREPGPMKSVNTYIECADGLNSDRTKFIDSGTGYMPSEPTWHGHHSPVCFPNRVQHEGQVYE